MKKTTTCARHYVLLLSLLGGVTFATHAQTPSDEPGQLRVKITERNGSDSRVIERTYRNDGLSDAKRDALVNKLIDSLRAARKDKGNNSNISVEIEDSYQGPSRKGRRNRIVEDGITLNGTGQIEDEFPGVVPIPPVPPIPPIPPVDFDLHLRYTDDSDLTRDLNRQLGPMTDRLNRSFRNFNWQRDFARPFSGWADGNGQTSTIKGLDVYPNNPDRNLLNVRFNAPAKGDVQIAVTNTKGKEVARRELKDFSGEFVGQVDIGRKPEGVFFVTVTQNDDGAVRRVVLKKEESAK
jgi:hypothetical protein